MNGDVGLGIVFFKLINLLVNNNHNGTLQRKFLKINLSLIPVLFCLWNINENFQNEVILGVSITRTKIKIFVIFYIWFSICSKICRRLIKNLSFTSGLKLDLAKHSYWWSPIFCHLHMDHYHLGYIKTFLQKKHCWSVNAWFNNESYI